MSVACRAALFFLGMVVALAGALMAPPALADEARWRVAFRELDTNGDGRVTREEFEINKIRVIFSRSSQDRSATLTFQETLLSRPAFDALDLDKDGVLSVADIVQAPFFRFVNFDTNTDGFIDFAEFSALMRSIER